MQSAKMMHWMAVNGYCFTYNIVRIWEKFYYILIWEVVTVSWNQTTVYIKYDYA